LPVCPNPFENTFDVDSLTAQARIQHEGIDVSGLFFFNEKGEFTRFESDDR